MCTGYLVTLAGYFRDIGRDLGFLGDFWGLFSLWRWFLLGVCGSCICLLILACDWFFSGCFDHVCVCWCFVLVADDWVFRLVLIMCLMALCILARVSNVSFVIFRFGF